ncbi:MAG TPA: PBP1A family penicillin-binding protein [Bryobacteraceae bacterium]|nr:PBP1A family penicillin-binding protein [Bryobacteraceae bacterium]
MRPHRNRRPRLYLPDGTLPRLALAFCVTALLGFTIVYTRYARIVSSQIGPGGIQIGSMIFSTPWVLEKGETVSEREVIKYLQRCGYRENGDSRIGQYRRTPGGLEITTGPDSYFKSHTAVIQFTGSRVSRIVSRTINQESNFIQLEPELVTNLVQGEREKRRPVIYSDLPKHLVQALISTEDKRFFDHSGLDFLRIAKALYVDLKERKKGQGASTITMQLARSFWLDNEKSWSRKFSEVLIAAELERRFSKEKILELYANEVYLGQKGSFSVHGFNQAARSYFSRDVSQLTLPESALLVAMIQRPAYFNPFKYPERAKARRDLVLTLMFNNGYIDAQQLARAQATPVRLNPGDDEATDAPYFVDLMNGEIEAALRRKLGPGDAYRVYTSLDMALQREAVEAVHLAMREVDRNVRAKRGRKNKAAPLPQVALVALDPSTGAVRALVGGRSYGESQLNRALAKRPPGSSFKPFVYAAALNTALERRNNVITAATTVLDAPTVFHFNGQDYEPGNFGDHFYGTVTLRQALMRSLNIPTIKVAEKTGYENVVRLARAAGMNEKMLPTPALALGAYEVTPLEIANAYTVFANGGRFVSRNLVGSIRDRNNRIIYTAKPEQHETLDPRVAFMMINLMEDVIGSGTAAGVRSRGFTHPAAGKTGTSRDGWFAGFTSNLLAVVWIGYDDYSDLRLEGSKSALPVWTEFMKRAHDLPQYRDTKPFTPPPGVVKVAIDPYTGLRAVQGCASRVEYFIDGTQPKGYSDCYSNPYDEEPGLEPVAEQRQGGFFRRVWDVFR